MAPGVTPLAVRTDWYTAFVRGKAHAVLMDVLEDFGAAVAHAQRQLGLTDGIEALGNHLFGQLAESPRLVTLALASVGQVAFALIERRAIGIAREVQRVGADALRQGVPTACWVGHGYAAWTPKTLPVRCGRPPKFA
jgi:hypothetical protein